MGLVAFIDHDNALAAARDEEVRRARQLLTAAQERYNGALTQDELDGYVCRYGTAVNARRMLLAEINGTTNTKLN